MIALLLALVVWMLGHEPAAVPTPAPHGVMVSPAAPTPAAASPGLSPGSAADGARSGIPSQRSAAAPTVAAPVECPAHPQMSDAPEYADCPVPTVEP